VAWSRCALVHVNAYCDRLLSESTGTSHSLVTNSLHLNFPSKFEPDSSLDQLAAQVYARTHPSFDIRIIRGAGNVRVPVVAWSVYTTKKSSRSRERYVCTRRRRSSLRVELDGTWSCRRESQQRRRTEIGRPVVACLAASLLRPAVTRRPLVIRPARPPIPSVGRGRRR
jgi:hypothetical protein